VTTPVSRRQFLTTAAAALPAGGQVLPFPVVDYHVHLNPSFSLDDAVALSRKMNVKFGIAEHAGTKENVYRAILSSDQELEQWIARLDGKPVYKGLQAEWTDWMKCFSRPVLARVDYVLSDTMTIPWRDGRRVKMWQAGFDPGDATEFMDRYVRWNVEVIEKEPLDILAHPTWLPSPLDKRYDQLWTEERIKPIIQALKRTETAVEIDSAYNIPRTLFLNMAKAEGLKFSFGSNSGTASAKGIDFCIATAKTLGLREQDMFVPARPDSKPFARRKLVA
jgi:histidinol phosphatase-like PHP family hydrolase